MKSQSIVYFIIAGVLASGLSFSIWKYMQPSSSTTVAKAATTVARVATVQPARNIQSLAWAQFQLFVQDGAGDSQWGPWETWVTEPGLANPASVSGAGTNPKVFKESVQLHRLILGGLGTPKSEAPLGDSISSDGKCTLADPSPCSSILYNALVSGHVNQYHLLDPAIVGQMQHGKSGGIPHFLPGSTIVKTLWLIIRHAPGNMNMGSLRFNSPDLPGQIETVPVDLTPNSNTSCDPKVKALPIPPSTTPKSALPPPPLPLSCFISFPVNSPETVDVIKSNHLGSAQSGDYLALMGMNIVRKEAGISSESPDYWMWSSFWWIEDPTANPDQNQKPPSLQTPQWSHYRGDAITSIYDPQGKPVYLYNPYIETFTSDPAHSNCVNCHQFAEYQKPVNGVAVGAPALKGPTQPTDAYFDQGVQTDNLWSLANILSSTQAKQASPPGPPSKR